MSHTLQSLLNPLKIGPVTAPNALALAPMAGYTDQAFRELSAEMGAGLLYTELVSARGLRYHQSIDHALRYVLPSSQGLRVLQLFGAEVDDFRAALEILLSDPRSRDFDMLDINMGCPVPKVTKTGAGSALLLQPERARAIIRALKRDLEGLPIALSAKTRLGFHHGDFTAPALVLALAEEGLDLICVHGRTRDQMYSGEADWGRLGELEALLSAHCGDQAPVFMANGDIQDCQSAQRCLEITGARALMLGRAAEGNPFLFRSLQEEIRTGRPPRLPSPQERAQAGRRHCQYLLSLVGEERGCREARKLLMHYVRSLPGAKDWRRRACAVSTAAELEAFWQAVELVDTGVEPGDRSVRN